MRGMRPALRAGGIILAIAGGVSLLGLVCYTLILQPVIGVSAPAGSTIRLTDMQTGEISQATINGSSTAIRTGVGSYMVAIDNASGSQIFYIKTAWLKHVSLHFAPPKQLDATLLAHQVAYNALGSNNSFAYLNTSAQTIEQLNGNIGTVLDNFGDIAPRNAATGAQAMKIIAGNRAIVLTHGQLYVLQHGRLDALNTEGFPDSIASLVVGTNAGQESFAVLANRTLYWYSSPSAQPHIVSILTKQADQLAVGGDEVIAYSTKMPDARQDIRYAYTPTYVIDPLLISAVSGSQTTIADGPIVDASISPDGQFATITQRDATRTSIVRLADSTTVESVENAATLTPQWISNTSYVYGKASSVWMFNVQTLSAYEIAALPAEQAVTSITYNTALQQYLVTTYSSEQEAAIYELQ